MDPQPPSYADRFDPAIPTDRAHTPPSSWYLDPAVAAAERRGVFGRNWIAVGRADEVAAPGTFFTARIGDDPIVVVRDATATLRAFANSCRHHATRVAEGSGSCQELVCPYHGWTYGLDGRLLRAPGVGGIRDFDREQTRLPALAVAQFGPLIFVNLASAPTPLEAAIDPVPARIGDLSALRFVERRVYAIECNWKVYVDNYLDGGYHVAHLHRGLAGQLDLASYQTEVFARSALQCCGGTDPRIGKGAVYAWIYPNVMLNRYGPTLDVNLVLPRGPERCDVIIDWYFEPADAPTDQAAQTQSIAQSDVVQREDVTVCEAVQQGLRSSFFDTGRYAPAWEAAQHQFHRLLHADLLQLVDRPAAAPAAARTVPPVHRALE